MSGKIREYIKIDINKGVLGKPYNYKIPAKLGDNGSRILVFQLYSNGEPFVLTSNQTVRLRLVKPDGYEVLSDCKISNANTGTVEVTLSSATLSKIGQAHGELMITSSSNYKLTTASFYINVTGCVSNGTATEGSNEFQALISGLDRLDKWDATFQTKYDTLESKYAEDLALCKEQVLEDSYTTTLTQTTSMSKVGVTGDVDVHASVRDGMFKSAILKGQTLVNHVEYKAHGTAFQKDDYMFTLVDSTKSTSVIEQVNGIKDQTLYTVIVEIAKNTISSNGSIRVVRNSVFGSGDINIPNGFVGVFKKTFTTNFSKATDLNGNNTIQYNTSGISSEELIIGNHMILEGDYSNIDIPFFEGMSDVKMPVLKTVGKNLFDGEYTRGAYIVNGKYDDTTYTDTYSIIFEVEKSETYNISWSQDSDRFGIVTYESKPKNGLSYIRVVNDAVVTGVSNKTFTLDSNEKYIQIVVSSNATGKVPSWVQIEKGSNATTYEPYKTNILTVNEPVELRGIGDVKDELNLLTGELTQRVNEIVLDGSEAWYYGAGNSNETIALFYLKLEGNKGYKPSINDKLPSIGGYGVSFGEGIYVDGDINIRVDCKKLNETSIDNFKQWLSNNPITLQYKLGQPSIKTVDLSSLPFAYQGGYIQLSSDVLTPELEYEVSANRSAQITQNNKAIIKHDKQINAMELMLLPTLLDLVESNVALIPVTTSIEGEGAEGNDIYHSMLNRLVDLGYDKTKLASKVSSFHEKRLLNDNQYSTLMERLDIPVYLN